MTEGTKVFRHVPCRHSSQARARLGPARSADSNGFIPAGGCRSEHTEWRRRSCGSEGAWADGLTLTDGMPASCRHPTNLRHVGNKCRLIGVYFHEKSIHV